MSADDSQPAAAAVVDATVTIYDPRPPPGADERTWRSAAPPVPSPPVPSPPVPGRAFPLRAESPSATIDLSWGGDAPARALDRLGSPEAPAGASAHLGPEIADAPVAPDTRTAAFVPALEPLADAVAGHPAAARLPGTIAERYRPLVRLGLGGMGEVWRAVDLRLERTVALKLVRAGLVDPEIQSRFLAEARLVAMVQHPGVVPVHDLGHLHDGRAFFVMAEVQGETLADRLARGGTSLRRRVEWMADACRTVAHAHDLGVLHLDLKPSNLMITLGGSVQVVDWGIAAWLDRAERAAGGTPGYMAPECHLGARPTARADVFGLGRTLAACLGAAASRPAIDPALHLVGEAAELADLTAIACEASAEDPERRTPDARTLAAQLEDWLDGEPLRRRAARLIDQAAEQARAIERLGAALAAARAEAARLSAALPVDADDDARRGAWQALDAAAALEERLASLAAQRVRDLEAALSLHPDAENAHLALALHARQTAEEAERAGHPAAAALARARVATHDRVGVHRRWLEGLSRLSLRVADPGATVAIAPFVEVDRRRTLGGIVYAGPCPAEAFTVPSGAWLCTLSAPGRATVRLPVSLGRDEDGPAPPPVSALPPGVAARPLRLPPPLPADHCPVPAGWARLGGDARAADPREGRRVWVEGVIFARDPVTRAQYARFLAALRAAGRHAEAARRTPTESLAPEAGPGMSGEEAAWSPSAAEADLPVVRVRWHDAVAYARWYAAETGLPWRLPTEDEWEKAARGPFGWCWPWGDHAEAPWARMLGSGGAQAQAAPVDAFPRDESPYGVRGLAGNVRDWCADIYTPDGTPEGATAPRVPDAAPLSGLGTRPPLTDSGAGSGPVSLQGLAPTRSDSGVEGSMESVPPEAVPEGTPEGPPRLRVVRGGNWASVPDQCRAAGRFAAPPEARFLATGFRLCYDWPTDLD